MLGWLFDRDYLKRESEEYLRRNSEQQEPKRADVATQMPVKPIVLKQNPYKTFAETFPHISQRYENAFQRKVEEVKRKNKLWPTLPDPLPKREDDVELCNVDKAPRVKKVLDSSSYLSENNTLVEIDTQGYQNITEYEIRPPVLRIAEDINQNFCSWTIVWVDELTKDYSVKELSKRAYTTRTFNAMCKDGIEVKWLRTERMGRSYATKQLKVNDVIIEINTKELVLIEIITQEHRANIRKEIKEEEDNKDTLTRLALDEVVKGILNKGE